MRTRCSAGLTAAALLAIALPVTAADPILGKPTITKTFNVADLVIPIPDIGENPGPIDARRESEAIAEGADRLTKLLTSMVRPNSWTALGGTGTVEFFSVGNVLVVKNSLEVVREVGDLLECIRRLQDITVATEVRIVKVPAGFCERVSVQCDGGAGLTEREMNLFLEAAQSDREANVMRFPKVSSFDGQTATIRTGQRRSFVTGGEVIKVKGQPMFVPKQKPVDLGDTLTVCGRVSADRKSISLRTNLSRTTLVGNVELVPITMMVTPVFEGGSRGQPIPFTQFLEAPEFRTRSFEKTAVVPDGGTVVIGGWTEATSPAPVPMLTKIPYVSKLFKTADGAKECEVVVLATARIIRAEPEHGVIAPMPHESTR
jgi:type II secretory pathway component GspD/PulD (secretin)